LHAAEADVDAEVRDLDTRRENRVAKRAGLVRGARDFDTEGVPGDAGEVPGDAERDDFDKVLRTVSKSRPFRDTFFARLVEVAHLLVEASAFRDEGDLSGVAPDPSRVTVALACVAGDVSCAPPVRSGAAPAGARPQRGRTRDVRGRRHASSTRLRPRWDPDLASVGGAGTSEAISCEAPEGTLAHFAGRLARSAIEHDALAPHLRHIELRCR
jgi:hypothetical protein